MIYRRATPSTDLILALIFIGMICSCSSKDGAKVMEAFYSNDGPEDTLMDPLILAGEEIVPDVLAAVRDRDMKRRRYAIGFLGNGGYPEAIPTLELIVADDTEEEYIRGDALLALCQINDSKAREMAESYDERGGQLGDVARGIVKGTCVEGRRTYWEALLGRHE